MQDQENKYALWAQLPVHPSVFLLLLLLLLMLPLLLLSMGCTLKSAIRVCSPLGASRQHATVLVCLPGSSMRAADLVCTQGGTHAGDSVHIVPEDGVSSEHQRVVCRERRGRGDWLALPCLVSIDLKAVCTAHKCQGCCS